MSKTLKVVIAIFSSLITIIILFSAWFLWAAKKDSADIIDRLARCKSACASGDTSDKTLECQVGDIVFTLNQFCDSYDYNNNNEEMLSTTTDTTLFRGLEDKGLLINFKDGYGMPGENIVIFGPEPFERSFDSEEISIRPYSLRVIPFKSAVDIISQVKNEKPYFGEPSIIDINGLQVVEYKTAGICDGRAVELVGISFNYLFSYEACGEQGNRDYLIETIKTIQLVK